ncbi:MAG: hypothetical protein KF762_12040 [Acidobacteria bacterium]|nr:hypothetical protein [Acidobacteriota bacterium]
MAFFIASLLKTFLAVDILGDVYSMLRLIAFLGSHGLICGIIAGRFGLKTFRGGVLGCVILIALVLVIILSFTLHLTFVERPPAHQFKGFFEFATSAFSVLVMYYGLIFLAVLLIPSIIDGAIIGFLTNRLSNLRRSN